MLRAVRGLVAAVLTAALPLAPPASQAQAPSAPQTQAAVAPPVSLSALIDQTVALFPALDGEVIEVRDRALTLAIPRRTGARPGLALEVFREGREIRRSAGQGRAGAGAGADHGGARRLQRRLARGGARGRPGRRPGADVEREDPADAARASGPGDPAGDGRGGDLRGLRGPEPDRQVPGHPRRPGGALARPGEDRARGVPAGQGRGAGGRAVQGRQHPGHPRAPGAAPSVHGEPAVRGRAPRRRAQPGLLRAVVDQARPGRPVLGRRLAGPPAPAQAALVPGAPAARRDRAERARSRPSRCARSRASRSTWCPWTWPCHPPTACPGWS